MGFHKRRIDSDHILSSYKDTGIDGVKRLFKADALFFKDDFSNDIHNLLLEGDIIKITNRINKEQNVK